MSPTGRLSDVLNIPARGGLAVIGIPLDMLNAGLTTPPAVYPDLIDFVDHRTSIWEAIRYDVMELYECGWTVDLHRGRAMINKRFSSMREAQEAVQVDLADTEELRENIGNDRTIEWLAGGVVPAGGFLLGEQPQPEPETFPLWLVATEVIQAERIESPDDLKPALTRLGNRGALSEAEVATEVAALDVPIEPFLEGFAGLGEINIVTESWLEYLGRAEIPSGPPEMYGRAPWVAPFVAIPELCHIWRRGAMSTLEDVDPDDMTDSSARGIQAIIEGINVRVDESEAELEARGGPLKTPMSSEQESEVIMEHLQAMKALFSEGDHP